MHQANFSQAVSKRVVTDASIRASAHQQVGVTLIEVLVAVLVMAIGLLGIAALQATALRNSQSSLERSQAVVHTYAILDARQPGRGEGGRL